MNMNMRSLVSAFCLTLAALVAPSAKAQMNMFFTNLTTGGTYDSNNIWITVQRGQNPTNEVTDSTYVPDITYGDGSSFLNWAWSTNIVPISSGGVVVGYQTNIGAVYAQSISLADIDAHGGYLTWISNAASTALLISYGAALPVTNSAYAISAISPSATNDPSYNSIYQPIEVTYNPSSGDQGDSSAINWFSSEVGMQTFASTNATGSILQKAFYNQSTQTIYQRLSNSMGANASTVILTNNAGQVTRVIGPTQLGAGNIGAYTNFNTYLGAMQTNTNLPSLVISNQSAYNTLVSPLPTNATYTNANVTFVMTNTVTGDATNGYGLQAVGTITMVITSYTNGGFANASTNTYPNMTFTVTPNSSTYSNSNMAAAFIYSGSYTQFASNTYIGGTNLTAFSNAMAPFVTGAGASAYNDKVAQIAGELSSSFAFGEAGSTNEVVINGVTNELGAFASGNWWNMTNPVAFSQAQTNSGFYDIYAGAFWESTSNSVYASPYSDRYKNFNPGLNVVQYVTNNVTNPVGSVLVTISDPIAVPEPSYTWAILLFLTSLAAYKGYQRRKKA